VKHIVSAILCCLAVCAAATVLPPVARATQDMVDVRQFEKGKTTLDEVVGKLGKPARSERNDEGLKAIGYLAPGASADSVPSLFAAASGPMAKSILGIYLFDKNGLMIHYQVQGGSGSPITSEDGAGPMPNLNMMQAVAPAPWPTDDKPLLGIHFLPVSQIDAKFREDFAAAKFNGLVVTQVKPGSVAQKAGIKKNDYLYILNGMLVTSNDEALAAMATVKKGDTIKAHVQRIDQDANRSQDLVFDLHF
jgi:hypothetical protein